MSEPLAIPMRLLLLNEEPLIGRPDGVNRFHANREWWCQCCSVYRHGGGGHSLSLAVTAGQANTLANIIDGKKGDRNWRIHLAAWGDSRGRRTRQFVKFLRGGGFTVMVPSGQEPGEARVLKAEFHFRKPIN